ncbi:hypothetical protein H257_05145 [Aphanomyces astaci]|uniref:Uncharacterized protein n=1 Tax=Aphanomyces astaci TaxID=112090 RepID=W4GT80_APHAT|nr:hypothetical protein H257_05145 [Aphanomyces astaci]ETV82541.1 hypothetical protein H257_05145 [Aphanomyces astaci]|eukprot:XP_009828210.1 hypothetical protein H257_05145 [Aphanomyces astaci]
MMLGMIVVGLHYHEGVGGRTWEVHFCRHFGALGQRCVGRRVYHYWRQNVMLGFRPSRRGQTCSRLCQILDSHGEDGQFGDDVGRVGDEVEVVAGYIGRLEKGHRRA